MKIVYNEERCNRCGQKFRFTPKPGRQPKKCPDCRAELAKFVPPKPTSIEPPTKTQPTTTKEPSAKRTPSPKKFESTGEWKKPQGAVTVEMVIPDQAGDSSSSMDSSSGSLSGKYLVDHLERRLKERGMHISQHQKD